MRFSVTTPRCCGSVWAYLEIDWGKSTESRTMTTSMIFTTRKWSHQGGSRTSCLSGPMLMRENWCVWMDGRTDEWVLKLEWVNGWSGPNFIFGKINDGQVVNRWPFKAEIFDLYRGIFCHSGVQPHPSSELLPATKWSLVCKQASPLCNIA